MPRRETTKKQQKICLAIGSVNERTTDVELPDNEWSLVSGVFPSSIGQQERIFGKRTLAKYSLPIMGIWQFWTPYGYAAGIYQFDGTVDYGVWITPSSKFPSLTLPPSVPFDGGGYFVDEFGDPWGRTIDVSSPNVCLIDFATVQTTHEFCGLSPSPSDTPDDANGGPAGQGSHCRWEQLSNTYSVAALQSSRETTENDFNTTVAQYPPLAAPGCGISGPVPLPVLVPQGPWVYVTAGFGGLSFGSQNSSNYSTSPALNPCGIIYNANQNQIAGGSRVVLDFTTLQPFYKQFSTRTVLQYDEYNPGFALPVSKEVVLNVTWDDVTGNFAAVPVDIRDYFPTPIAANNGFNGQDSSAQVVATGFKIYYNKRICTPN